MKRILHVIDTTGPGGAETVFIELLSRLKSERYESIVVIRGTGWVYDELQRRGFEPYIVDAKGSFNFRYLLELMKIVRRKKIDLIQAHLLGSGVYCSIVSLLTRIPVVVTLHGLVDVDGERFLSAKFFILNKFSNRLVLVSKDLLFRLKAIVALNDDNISVIYNGADLKSYALEKHQKLKVELGLKNTDVLVGSVGNVRTAKAYDVLLRAAALLIQREPGVKFLIVGDTENDLFQEISALRSALSLEDAVFFLGFRQHIPEFLAGVDIFLLSSISEGCPVSVVEAMASRVPMVVTDCGGLSEMVEDGVSALMCEPGSPEALLGGLERLLNDSALREELAENGKEVAKQKFSMDAMLDSYRSIYEDLLCET